MDEKENEGTYAFYRILISKRTVVSVKQGWHFQTTTTAKLIWNVAQTVTRFYSNLNEEFCHLYQKNKFQIKGLYVILLTC